ncbi:hypothetical protein [Nostoc sp.]|uniref:hypothetical protein n=1 Tax=Nostoc sp. TaxID=1180 RepID=UPI002FF94F4D
MPQKLFSLNVFLPKCCAKIKPEQRLGIGMTEEAREVRGRIPKSLKIAFEIACARLEITQTAALEEAIKEWLKKHESTSSDK